MRHQHTHRTHASEVDEKNDEQTLPLGCNIKAPVHELNKRECAHACIHTYIYLCARMSAQMRNGKTCKILMQAAAAAATAYFSSTTRHARLICGTIAQHSCATVSFPTVRSLSSSVVYSIIYFRREKTCATCTTNYHPHGFVCLHFRAVRMVSFAMR